MKRAIRYQGAILQESNILLIQHREHAGGRSYWLLPGGGIEAGETEEACVLREMKEETGLDVSIERLLLDEPAPDGDTTYQRRKTYVCRIVAGDPQPGYEPEPEVAARYGIAAVGWFDLRSETNWGEVGSDRFTYPQLKRIQAALGYAQTEPE